MDRPIDAQSALRRAIDAQRVQRETIREEAARIKQEMEENPAPPPLTEETE